MLDTYPRTQLCLMLTQYGTVIMTEPKRCKNLLSDLAPQFPLENNLLMAVLEQKIAEQLLKPSVLVPIEIQLERFARQLNSTLGIELSLAYWAVESWALALKLIAQPVIKKLPPSDKLAISAPLEQISPMHPPTSNSSSRLFVVLFFITSLFAVSLFVSINYIHSKGKKNTAVLATVLKAPAKSVAYDIIEPEEAWNQNNLGDKYFDGRGVEKNHQLAVKWYRKAAEQGDIKGQCNLGFMYYNGYGIRQDYTKAAEWYRKAAEQGDSDGQYNLGILYEYGQGVEQNAQTAISWYRKAIEQGHYGAQQRLEALLEKLKSRALSVQ